MNRVIICLTVIITFFSCSSQNSTKCEIQIKDASINDLSIENAAMKPQFALGLANIGTHLNGSLEVRDTLGNKQTICALFKDKKSPMLVCRISDNYCHECCELAVKKLLLSEPNFDMSRVVFFTEGAPRAMRLQMNEYKLATYQVYNCNQLGIPAENVMFPYYMIIDDSLTVRSIYMPNKAAFNLPIDSINLNLMYKTLIGQ